MATGKDTAAHYLNAASHPNIIDKQDTVIQLLAGILTLLGEAVDELEAMRTSYQE